MSMNRVIHDAAAIAVEAKELQGADDRDNRVAVVEILDDERLAQQRVRAVAGTGFSAPADRKGGMVSRGARHGGDMASRGDNGRAHASTAQKEERWSTQRRK